MILQPICCKKEFYPNKRTGSFYLGGAEDILPSLLPAYKEAVQLIYLDPPFQTGDTFYFRPSHAEASAAPHTAYSDKLDDASYLSLMRKVLTVCRELLTPEGCIYVHIDFRMSAHLRLLMDEIFGAKNFRNEIIWAYRSGGLSRRQYARKHDNILFYSKTEKMYFNLKGVGVPRGPERTNHMKRVVSDEGHVQFSIRSAGKEYIYREDSLIYPSDVWTDIPHLHQRDPERNGYATQKPEALLRRIITASSRPGDIVADFFSGSGTTAAVAQKMARSFIGCDSSPFALYALRLRIMQATGESALSPSNGGFSLYFPEESQKMQICASAREQEGTLCCTCQSFGSASNPQTLLYCALGYYKDNAFTPHTSILAPACPFSLCMPMGANATLQIIDSAGMSYFMAITD